ncbi:MAG: hypothetical protein KF819_12425 [Labilithrix sp.]|nr:hypothetical protein [Labilithrix sp.]
MKPPDGEQPDPDATLTIDVSEVTAFPTEPEPRRSRATPPPLPPDASMPPTASFAPQPSAAPPPPRSPVAYVAILVGAFVAAIAGGWFFSQRSAPPPPATPTAAPASASASAAPPVITIPTVEMGNE